MTEIIVRKRDTIKYLIRKDNNQVVYRAISVSGLSRFLLENKLKYTLVEE